SHTLVSGGQTIQFTLSVGFALADDSMTYNDLIKCADAHLYTAKESGRDMIWPKW
ncbi:MAG: diguanylate cyclase, partial [Erysipelotrichaceae bacterium]|nr:diguanylate cyclase [Erysipelotrichaceae bacterium]